MPKLRPSKKTLPASFLSCLLKNIQVELTFLYALLPCHKGAKWNTIVVTKGASAKLPHHKGLVPTYPIENKTPFIHHAIESYGCNYTIKDDKSLNERIRGHPMMKPKSKLM
jgi:hypothetical protein